MRRNLSRRTPRLPKTTVVFLMMIIMIRIVDAGFVVTNDQHFATTPTTRRRIATTTKTTSFYSRNQNCQMISSRRLLINPTTTTKTTTTTTTTSLNSFLPARNFFSSVVRRRNKNKNDENQNEEVDGRTTTVAEQIDDLVILDETRNGEGTYNDEDYDDAAATTTRTVVTTTKAPIMTKSSLFTSLQSTTPPSTSEESTSSTDDREKNSKIVQEEFENDLTKVLKVLMPNEYDDPEVPAFLKRTRLSLTNAWTLEDWVNHSTRLRFIHYVKSFPTSRLLNRVRPQLSIFMLWTIIAIIISPRGVLSQAVIPLTPLALISTFVGALLTMRSNTGLARLAEGRVAWGIVVLHTREISQLLATKVYPHNRQLSILLTRHLSIFGWVLKAHIRGTQRNVADIVRTMLPAVDAEYVLSQRKLPVAILYKLRQGIHQLTNVSGSSNQRKLLTTAEEMAFERSIEQLDHAIMTMERIRASPIPPLYTSHTSRLLMFYLWFLPLALHQSSLTGIVTFLVSIVVGYTMLGLDEISHLLEQPFRLMPLLQLSKISMLDVGDSLIRRPPSIEESLESQLSCSISSTTTMDQSKEGEESNGLSSKQQQQQELEEEERKVPEYW